MISKSLIKELSKSIGKNNILTDPVDLYSYSYDAAVENPSMPQIILKPENTNNIGKIISLLNEDGIPTIIRGAGTNLSGGTIPINNGAVILTNKLNQILEINKDDMYAVVEPGVVTANLSKTLEKYDLFYPPDPASQNVSTLGGNVAENAGGLRGLKYGVTKDYVMGLEFYDTGGNLIKSGSKTVKCATGLNLSSLMVGSEGTLGIITKIILKLLPKPAFSKTMMVVYKDIIKASETVSEIIANKILPATLEFLDNFTIKAVEKYAKIGLPTNAATILLIEVDGFYEEAVKKDFDKIIKICEKKDGEVRIANNLKDKNRLWDARRVALSALSMLSPTVILEDATVKRSRIPDMIKIINEISKKYDILIGTFGHAGDGNLHPTILTDKRKKEEMERVYKAIEELFLKTIELEGTLSGEHGIGFSKSKYFKYEAGESTIEFSNRLKQTFDPKNILNPDKFLKIV
ncbi:MAG: FAD-linked oxidase C-terminal domain-containing protein [Deferribacterota bacterium]|nr:FAD-linked oxidase C-terminal domain-containing protein [Deferribacterota bacterium]